MVGGSDWREKFVNRLKEISSTTSTTTTTTTTATTTTTTTTTTTPTTSSSLNFAQISLKLRREELLNQNRVRNHRPSFTQDFNDNHSSEEEVNHRDDDHVNNNGGKIQTEQLYYPVTSAEIIREKDSNSNTRLREGLLRKGLQNHRIRGGGIGLNRAGGTVS